MVELTSKVKLRYLRKKIQFGNFHSSYQNALERDKLPSLKEKLDTISTNIKCVVSVFKKDWDIHPMPCMDAFALS